MASIEADWPSAEKAVLRSPPTHDVELRTPVGNRIRLRDRAAARDGRFGYAHDIALTGQ
jgi:hypothetical protein